MKTLINVLWGISAAVLVTLGIYFIFNPGVAIVSLVYWLGFSVLLNGIFSIAQYFQVKKAAGSGWILFDGIVSTLFGVLLLFTNVFVFIAASLPLFFGIWIGIKGIFGIIQSNDLRKFGMELWYLPLIIGIIGILLGVLALFQPMFAIVAIAVMVGLHLVTSGITSFAALFVANKIAKEIDSMK